MSKKQAVNDIALTVKPYFGVLTKLIVLVLVIVGLVDTSRMGGYHSASLLLYYTIQSNIFIAILCLVFMVFDILEIAKKRQIEIPRWLYIIKFILTLGVALSFLIFWLTIVPMSPKIYLDEYIKTASNLCCHTFVPIFAVLDWLLYNDGFKNKKRDYCYGLITSLYFIMFSYIASACGAKFVNGSKVPYIFLDYEAFGWFAFGQNGGMGVFWWLVVVCIVTLLLGYLLIKGKNKIYQKKLQREMKLPIGEIVTKEYDDKKDNK